MEVDGALWDSKEYIAIIRNTYEGMACQVLHRGTTTEKFSIKTGVRQGFLLSPFLFLLAVDWIMRESTKQQRTKEMVLSGPVGVS